MKIKSKIPNDAYREAYDRVFRAPRLVEYCTLCGMRTDKYLRDGTHMCPVKPNEHLPNK